MKIGRILIIGAVCALGLSSLNAQNCKKEHTYCDQSKDNSWQTSHQSKSAAFGAGEEHEMSVVVYDGMDYRFSFCTNEPSVDGKIEFEIYTMKTVKKYDSKKKRMGYVKEKEVRYDNRTDELSQEIEISADGTKTLYFSVHVPEGASEGKRKMAAKDVVCVGVLVQHQKAIDTGWD